jgi:hypothetical protein
MMPTKSGIIATILVVFFAAACQKQDTFPVEPVLTFKSLVAVGDSAILNMAFTDGDGDVGLDQGDTLEPYLYNCFLEYQEKQGKEFKTIVLPIPFNFRIPKLNPSGKAKPILGNIRVVLTPTFYNPFSATDSVKFRVYITDRALNKSNVITTSPLAKPK